MTVKNPLVAIVATSVLLFSLTATAQPVSDDAAVWSVIEQSWQAERQGDVKWVENLLSADFVGWSNDCTRAARQGVNATLEHIFVQSRSKSSSTNCIPCPSSCTATWPWPTISYSTASRPKGEKVSVTNGRYTDILVRMDGQWKYISWHGGESD